MIQSMQRRNAVKGLKAGATWLTFSLLVGSAAHAAVPAQASTPAAEAASTVPAQTPGAPFTPAQLSNLLPQGVYFAGKTAPLQLRNTGGTKFANGTIFWVGLVDTSGYSTGVQEHYQFYLVTEGPVRIGDVELGAGAYGGGFVGDRFALMDLGDHVVAQGPTQADAGLRRPRPLQVLPDRPDAVKLYLGRKWVSIRTSSPK